MKQYDRSQIEYVRKRYRETHGEDMPRKLYEEDSEKGYKDPVKANYKHNNLGSEYYLG